uniref:Uncharacterized protein n=1 Tax=Romanomermis culicivorax TaxID=13658 RepID=A0A915I7Y6_ROMCU
MPRNVRNYGIELKDLCSFDEFGVLERESRSLEQCLADCFNDDLQSRIKNFFGRHCVINFNVSQSRNIE